MGKENFLTSKPTTEFERATSSARSGGVLADFWYLLRSTNKWWLAPLVLVLLAIGGLLFLSGTAAAPFIYTLF